MAGSLSNLSQARPQFTLSEELSLRRFSRDTATAGHKDKQVLFDLQRPGASGVQAVPSELGNRRGQHHSLSSDDALQVISLAPVPLGPCPSGRVAFATSQGSAALSPLPHIEWRARQEEPVLPSANTPKRGAL